MDRIMIKSQSLLYIEIILYLYIYIYYWDWNVVNFEPIAKLIEQVMNALWLGTLIMDWIM